MKSEQEIKKIKRVIVITLLQSLSLIYLLVINDYGTDMIPYYGLVLKVVIGCNIGASLFNIYFLKDFDQLLNKFLSYNIIKAKVKEQKKFIDKLRSQRHDFINQLQTIGMMAQMEKTEKIIEYVQEAGAEIKKLDSSKYKTSTLQLILEQKKQKAQKLGVNLKYNINNSFNSQKLSTNELFRLFYNLIDNALDAAVADQNPQVEVKGMQQQDDYVVSVYNNGQFIDQELKEKIQNPGASTKGSTRGYGLYIVKSLLDKANGELEIISNQDYGTEFICRI